MQDKEKTKEELLHELSDLRKRIIESKNAEKKLKQVNLYNRSLIEISLDPLITIGTDGKITDVNVAAEKVTGYLRNELIGSDFHDHFTEPDKAREVYELVFKKGIVRDYPLDILNKDGNVTSVVYNASVYRDESGEVRGVLAAARDITQLKEAYEKLRSSEERFKILFDHAPDSLFILDMKGNLVDCNRAVEKNLGYPREEFIGKNFASQVKILPLSQIPKLAAKLAKIALGHRPIEPIELDFTRKDGEKIIMEFTAYLVNIKGQRLLFAIGRDITERKKYENELKKNEESLAEAQKIAKIGNWEWDLKTNKVTSSDELYHIFGTTTKGDGEDFDSFIKFIHTDDRKFVEKSIKALKENKHAKMDYRIILPDGSERMTHAEAKAVLDDKGNLLKVFGTLQDITERKKIEEELKSSEERFKILFKNAPDSYFLTDLKGNIVDCNKATEKLTTYKREELIGKNFAKLKLITPSQIPKLVAKTAKMALGSPPETTEIDFKRRDGKKITVEVHAYMITMHGKKLFLGTARDITERKQMEVQIRESLEEKEMLLKEIHHRVKNNLMIISSLLNLQSNYIKDKEALDIFKESQSRARSMAIIHERLYQSIDLKRIDFGEYIRTLAMELFRTYQADPVRIKMNMNVESLELDINTTVPLGLIVNELVSNSMKHAFPGDKKGDITIDFHKIGNEYELKVYDTGVGFPEHIDFKNTETLGLQLVNNLVGQLDGTIELDQTHGTGFTIKFKELKL